MMRPKTENYNNDPVSAPIPAGTSQPAPEPALKNLAGMLTLFYAKWCGHCKKLIGDGTVWADMKRQAGNKSQIIEMEASDPSIRNYGVNSFPTIRYYPDGLANPSKFVQYSGDRSVGSILQFLEEQTK